MHLSLSLRALKDGLTGGARDLPALEAQALHRLRDRGWQPDYLTVRRRADLLPPTPEELGSREPLVALGAAKLGTTRLIDNLEL